MKNLLFTLLLSVAFSASYAQFRVRSDGDSNVPNDRDLYIGQFGDSNYRVRFFNNSSYSIFDYQPDLYFRAAPVSGSSYPTYLRLKTSGFVGVFTDPSYRLDVNGDVRAVSYITISDERLKKNIVPLSGKESLEKLSALKGMTYTYDTDKSIRVQPLLEGETAYDQKVVDTDPDRLRVGFLAQQVKEILPEAVQTDKDGYLGIDYSLLIPLLVEALKEQQAQINQLSQKLR